MSKRDVKLFLGGKEVEFKTTPDILYNFNVDDITSPAAVKNSYSKTITIPGTPSNNRIFGVYGENDNRGIDTGSYTGAGFDPRMRLPFSITVNGDVYETGYAKLTGINQNKNYLEYSVSLFGGLGDFFYSLEYGDDASKRKLSSLIFRQAGSEVSLDFILNKGSVKSAWTYIPGASWGKWGIINFAPAYEGYPQDFDANKVLVNYHNADQYGAVPRLAASGVTSGGTNYGPYNGYALVTMPKERTMWEMRDWRSWQFRPVLSVKRTIEAICLPENNGGYEVELDDKFFNSSNTLYANAVVTLPKFTEMKISDYSTSDKYTTHTVTATYAENYNYWSRYTVQLSISPSLAVNTSRLELDLDLQLSGWSHTGEVLTDTMYSSAIIQSTEVKRNFSALAVQLAAYAGVDQSSALLGVSNVAWLTSLVDDDYLRPSETLYAPLGENASIDNVFGTFVRYNGLIYKWSVNPTLRMDVPIGAKSFFLVMTPVANITRFKDGWTYGDRRRQMYTSTSLQTPQGSMYVFNSNCANSSTLKSYVGEGQTAGYSGAEITKGMLLDTDYSPADFLLSYCKMFGLYFIKDPIKKKISILTRDSFFKRGTVVDVQNLIDRSSVKITPLAFDSKWYRWQQEQTDSEFADIYQVSTGKEYGEMDVNTQYAFNSDTKEVLDNNSFKSGVMATERSNMYFSADDDIPSPWMYSNYSMTLLDRNTAQSAITINVPKATTFSKQFLVEDYQYYDLFEKPVFHTENNAAADGKNVLLIHLGNKQLLQGNGSYLRCYLTDDLPEMGVLNEGKACWLWTRSTYNDASESIATRVYQMPQYSRYKVNEGNGYIQRALDFGVPEKLYVPGIGFREGATLYSFFWKDYMDDVFSRDSRIMECKMWITQKPSVEMLRQFYWFDNAIWRMTKIKDYNAASDKLTDVTFVKVQDIQKYTSKDPSGTVGLFLTLDEETVGPAGGSVPYHIVSVDGEPWAISAPAGSPADVVSGDTDWDGTWTVGTNYSTSPREVSLTVYDVNDSVTKTITQSGYTLNFYRCDENGEPIESKEFPNSGGTFYFYVVASEEWFFHTTTANFFSSMSVPADHNTKTNGMIISCVLPENTSYFTDRTTSIQLGVHSTGYYIQEDGYVQPDKGL